jgi:hypothetical protein
VKNAIFWDVMPCGSCNNRHFIHSSEISVLTRATWHNIPEDSIVHSHRCENLTWREISLLSFFILIQLLMLLMLFAVEDFAKVSLVD